MPIANSIPVGEFCSYYNIEVSFLDSLGEAGLLDPHPTPDQGYLHFDQLAELEKFIRMHQELEINLAGIEAISHLLSKMQEMKREIITLKNRLNLYEGIGV